MDTDLTLPAGVLERLRCPRCRAEVTPEPDGGLTCPQGHTICARAGYLDASQEPADQVTDATLRSFGYEWNTFDDVRQEDEDFAGIYFADLALERLEGRVGLDAGCGKGRYSRFLAPHLDALVALDGSAAVEAAARNLATVANVIVVKSDLRTTPFAPASFGFISCLGVLHHLSDPREGLDALVDLLEPGGLLLVYLYSRPQGFGLRSLGLSGATLLRRWTVRMSPHRLRALSAGVAAGLYGAVVVPGRLGQRWGGGTLARLPMPTYRDKPWRSLWLDTFDRLSAPVEHRYRWSDVQGWFADAGLQVEQVREQTGLFILARRD